MRDYPIMQFILIDYSKVYYETITKTTVPSMRGGRFVQIRDEAAEYLVLSPKGLSSFHANIVERFCLLQGLEGKYTSKRMDKYEILDSGWDIIGGGKWFVNDEEKWFHLFDKSGVYGKFDPVGLRHGILVSGKYKGYDIKITI